MTSLRQRHPLMLFLRQTTAMILTCLFLVPATPALAIDQVAARTSNMYFVAPIDGDTVFGSVFVRFAMNSAEEARFADQGPLYHHLLVDGQPFNARLGNSGKPKPSLKFAKGKVEAWVDLPPGVYTLQLVTSRQNRSPGEPLMQSEPIRITVQ